MSKAEGDLAPIEKRIHLHAEKNQLINSLLLTERGETPTVLLPLSRILSADSALSNTQKSKLVRGLENIGYLTYQDEFVESGAEPVDIDRGRWDIDKSGEAQIAALGATYELTSSEHSIEDIVTRLVSVMNAGHKAGTEASEHIREPLFEQSYDDFVLQEERVFQRRQNIAERLIALGLVDKDQLDDVVDSGIAEFRNVKGYDEMLIVELSGGIGPKTSFYELFLFLQDILYLGHGMAMRDSAVVEQREQELYS